MKIRFFGILILLISACLPAAEQARPGQDVDLAPFGYSRVWDGNPGVEWDEPRDVRRVEVELAAQAQISPPDSLQVEYWVSSWPPIPRGGWTQTDTTWQGQWRVVTGDRKAAGKAIVLNFAPLTDSENPNARNVAEFNPTFRRTLKVRVRFLGKASSFSALHVYGRSRWNVRTINVQSGCEGKEEGQISATAHNGIMLDATPFEGRPRGMRFRTLYTEHEPLSNDRTILTLHVGQTAFGVSVDDVIERKGIYVRALGVFIGDGAVGETFESWLESGAMRPGEDIISRTSKEPEQSLAKASSEIPALSLTARSSHPHHWDRYVPLGFPGSREKYALDVIGNVFISKHSAKAMKEDLARMLWEGDEIDYLVGTGPVPDFRERAKGVRQSVAEDYLPLVTTRWQADGIEYEEQAYATMLDAPLDETSLRGDEPSLLFLKVSAHNPSAKDADALLWFHVRPDENLDLTNGLLRGTGNKAGFYARPRLRAAFDAEEGDLQIRALPVTSPYLGQAVVWAAPLPAQATKVLVIKIPFRTMETPADQQKVRVAKFGARLEETMSYWKKAGAAGMQLKVPDAEFNSFFRAGLLHTLVSIERDVASGLFMCPCGTYDYNMFANETMMQVRLLDMRGLHDLAWRCLRPYVDLQGSHPFPGRFKDTSAIFHGVRVDADHDYTHSGYNLNHGWVLWTLAEHFFFTRDLDWLRSVMPRMLKAADWIISERKATLQKQADGTPAPEYGLLPPGQLEDNEEWQYWFAVNGYAYRGLKAAADAAAAVDAGEGERLKKEAAAYREDIRQAAFRAMAIAPVVPLRDGTYVPLIPPRTSLHGRDFGWIRNVLYGGHSLVDCGVFEPDEPAATWTLEDYEDNLFMAEDSLSVPDRDWFSRGGVALQPNLVNTFESYLKRSLLPQALRAFYNTFAISYYPDVNAFTEWVPTLGIGGGPFYKTSDESAFLSHLRELLALESGEVLYLNFGSPRDWSLPGRTIEIERSMTFFGELGFRIESHIEQGFIQGRLWLPQRTPPRQVILRLRHPYGKRMARVELNGHDWFQFDAQRETISLPPTGPEVVVRAFY